MKGQFVPILLKGTNWRNYGSSRQFMSFKGIAGHLKSKKPMSTNIKFKKVCEFCGEHFIAKTTVTRYCSHKCNSRHYKQLKRDEKLGIATVKSKVDQLDIPDIDFGRLAEMEFLNIKEVSVLIGISERTIYRLMKNGSLETKKIGRRTIIPRYAIDQLLNSGNDE